MAPRKTYILKLYVAGNTANSMRALKTLRNILDTEFQGVYALKVIDVLQNPQLAEEDKILATPTLAKILPPPVRRIIGDLSDREKVLIGLDLLYDELSEEEHADAEERLRLSTCWRALGLPAAAAGWTNKMTLDYLRLQQQKVAAFASGMHARLGAASGVSWLDEQALVMIADEVLGGWGLLKEWRQELVAAKV